MDELQSQLNALNINLNDLIKQAIEKSETMLKNGFLTEAEMVLKQLLKVDSKNQQAFQLYGLLLFKNKKYQESIDMLNQAIAADPDNPDNYNNIGLSYLHSGQTSKALEMIEKANNMKSDYNYMNNLALANRANGDLEKSISIFKNSLSLKEDARTWQSLGSCYGQKKDINEAINCFKKALEIDPQNLASRVDLAYAYHLIGEWDKGWEEYESRLEYWHKEGRNPGKFYEIYPPEKAWDGKTSIENKNILVYCEQGTGDLIQFARFIPNLTKMGANVCLDLPPSLEPILKDFAKIRLSYNEKEDYDYHCSILSLPYLLKLKVEDFKKDEPYIHVEKSFDMSDYDNFFKIGIVWAGNPGHPNDINRSCYLKNFKQLSRIPCVKLFSLQKEIGKRVYVVNPDCQIDLTEDCDDMPLVDMSEYLTDYEATAKIIQEMDLIITVDTSVLHLAGAIGKETFALIPYNPDWRWGLDGENNVWYSSVTLFRQENPGDWSIPFKKIKEKITLNENNL